MPILSFLSIMSLCIDSRVAFIAIWRSTRDINTLISHVKDSRLKRIRRKVKRPRGELRGSIGQLARNWRFQVNNTLKYTKQIWKA